ncbi:D-amino acid dehydrogenase OS=Castellaniella defragrans OX=75697 GN=dadA PE=3 SV=1 [Castellaniella defragrans]
MTMKSPRIVVVGAGIVGLATAHYLAQMDADVLVIDAGTAGAGCSWGNAGWITPETLAPLPGPGIGWYALKSIGRPASPLYLEPRIDVSLFRWLWRFWRSSNPRTYEAGRHALLALGCGTIERFDELHDKFPFVINSRESLRIFDTMDAARRVSSELHDLGKLGFPNRHTLLAPAEVCAMEPLLSKKLGGAILQRDQLQVEPASLSKALVEAIVHRGGRVVENQRVTNLVASGGKLIRVETQNECYEGSHFVFAAGCATPDLLSLLGIHIQMQAGKGYSFTVDLGKTPERMIDLYSARCGIAPYRGRARVVGTMELSGNNSRMDYRRVRAMVQAAAPYLGSWPNVDPASLENLEDIWVGMRPMLPDGLPIIDRLLLGNAYVNTGHAMMGVSLALSGGQALSQFVVTGVRPDQLRPFRLHR